MLTKTTTEGKTHWPDKSQLLEKILRFPLKGYQSSKFENF